MSTLDQRRSATAGRDDAAGASAGDELLWQHAAFCRLALPLRSPAEPAWRRAAAGAALRMEAAAGGAQDTPLPFGKDLRLLLIHLCTEGRRAETPVVPLGESAEELARAIGLDRQGAKLRGLADQLARLLGTRVAIALGHEPEFMMLDARGARPSGAPGWRPTLRLSKRFHAGLRHDAVPLSRAVVAALQDAPAALDAYAWLADALARLGGDAAATVSWEELRARYGNPAQPAARFRAGFEESLRSVRALWREASFEPGPDGITVHADPAALPPGARGDAAEEAQAAPPRRRGRRDAVPQPSLPLPGRAAAEDPLPAADAAPSPAAGPAPKPEPGPLPAMADADPRPAAAPGEAAAAAPDARVGLMPHLTGLQQAIWLTRQDEREGPAIEIAPPGRYDPLRAAVAVLEPIFLLVAGHVQPRELDRVALWAAANADLIEAFWSGAITSADEVKAQVKRAPTTRW